MSNVSIIIPVYNVEKYLSRCLDSIISQTYQDFEIICINDGSTDNSRLILEQYQKLDDRIIIYDNKKHTTAAETRNFGIDVAKGKYIMFVDSDDYIATTMVEKMVGYIEQTGAEVIVTDYFARNFRKYISNHRYIYRSHIDCDSMIKLDKNDALKYLYLSVTCWNRIFSAEFFRKKNVRFPLYPIYEDLVFWADVYLNADKIYYVPEAYYFYRRKKQGSLMQKRDENVLFVVDVHEKTAELFKQHNMYKKMKTVLDYIMIRDFCVRIFSLASPYNEILFNRVKERNYDIDISEFDELKLGEESGSYVKYYELLVENNFEDFCIKTKEHIPIDV